MRFSRECPKCGKPIWKGKKWTVLGFYKDGEEMVIRVEYDRCGCIVTLRRPHKGVKTMDGYVMISTPDGYQPEHRFVWEQAHGKLEKGIVVHHINGIRQDNRLENLIALPRSRHNNSMSQPEPFKILCPHCRKEVKIIKCRKNEYIVV